MYAHFYPRLSQRNWNYGTRQKKNWKQGIERNLELIMYISSFIPLGNTDVSNVLLPSAQQGFEVLFPISCWKKENTFSFIPKSFVLRFIVKCPIVKNHLKILFA